MYSSFLHSILVLGELLLLRAQPTDKQRRIQYPELPKCTIKLANTAKACNTSSFRASLEFGPFPAKLSIITTNSKNRFSQTANHALIPGTSGKHDKLNSRLYLPTCPLFIGPIHKLQPPNLNFLPLLTNHVKRPP